MQSNPECALSEYNGEYVISVKMEDRRSKGHICDAIHQRTSCRTIINW